MLVHQIESGLYQRQVLAEKVSNFESRLPSPQSELAAQTMKDPYIFDFIPFKEDMVERDIEQALVKDVTKLLLELGTGFDGDLSLRENIFLRGALLGYSKPFMVEKCEEILDFAELKEFENRKYKQLSSGMKSRLAFSIACFVNPDILILDEVLSVGDGSFRAKSEKKMMEIIKGGATTLFVSHSLMQVKRLSNKVLWLHKGEQIAFGPTAEICPKYEKFLKDGILPERTATEET